MKTKYLLVYGTLRKKAHVNYNYERYGTQTHVADMWVSGYDMHSLGSYPAVTPGNGMIFCELHEVAEDVVANITRMEKGAGYEVHEHEVEHPSRGMVKASLYAMPTERMAHYTTDKILSGDWNERELAR